MELGIVLVMGLVIGYRSGARGRLPLSSLLMGALVFVIGLAFLAFFALPSWAGVVRHPGSWLDAGWSAAMTGLGGAGIYLGLRELNRRPPSPMGH